MAVRLQRQSLLNALFAAVVAVGAVGGVFASHRVQGLDPFIGAAIGMASGAAAVTCLFVLEPAVILTAAMLLSVFSGDWSYMGIPIPLDRIAIVCGIAAALLRSVPRGEGPRIRTVHWLMLALLLFAVASAGWAHTLTQHGPEFALVDRLGLVPFLLFLVAPVAFRTPQQRRILAIGLIILGLYLGLISLFEEVGLTSLVVPSYINNPALGIHFGRSRGPFLEAGANGLAMFDCLAAAAITLPSWRGRPALRAGVIAVMILCGAGIIFSLTRQVWLGTAVGTLAAMLWNPRLRRLLPAAAVVTAIVVAVALAVVPGLSSTITARTSDKSSEWDRLNSDFAALRMVEARPALGFGWGTFGTASIPYYRLSSSYPLSTIDVAHNMPLSNAAELGLVGLGLWLAVMIAAIVTPALRRAPPALEPWRLTLIAVAIAWFIQANLSPLDYAFDNYIIWLWAGIVFTRRERAVRAQEPPVAARVHSLSAA